MQITKLIKMVFLAAALAALPSVFPPNNLALVPNRLRYSRTLQGNRGPLDGSRRQKQVIKHIVNFCGEDLMLYHDNNVHAYPLAPVLKRARDECEPLASVRQVRRWFNFWMDNSETPVERKKQKQSARNTIRLVVISPHIPS